MGSQLIKKGTKQRVFQKGYFVEHVIRPVKVFWVVQQRFPLNSQIYEQVILTICGLVTLGICGLVTLGICGLVTLGIASLVLPMS
ncbi:hypothetical protein [Trichormus azollae]|uniref:hypothetical protein n=1 Tax=Trichormus azollae TaxID=1164 RepID=UPI00325CEF0F